MNLKFFCAALMCAIAQLVSSSVWAEEAQLSAQAQSVSASNDTIFTSSGGEIEGFPRNSKKAALLSGCEEYLDIRFTLLSFGGKEIKMPSGKPSHYKPSLLVVISKFDKSGILIKKYKYNYKEFNWKGNFKKSIFVKQVVDRRNTLLHPEDLYILIRKGIEMTLEKIENNE